MRSVILPIIAISLLVIIIMLGFASCYFSNNYEPEITIEHYNKYDLNHDGKVNSGDYAIMRLEHLSQEEKLKNIILEIDE